MLSAVHRFSVAFLCLLAFGPALLVAQTCAVGSTVTVTNTNNSGTGSLRFAIDCANTTPSVVNISFNIPGTGDKIIRPTTPLSALNKANATIDGSTQPVGNIILDGSLLTATGNGLTLNGNGITVKRLFIRNFNTPTGVGIVVNATTGTIIDENFLAGNSTAISTTTPVQTFTISQNILGISLTGSAQGNTNTAINIQGNPSGGSIIGNTIANTTGPGINIVGGTVLISSNAIYCNTNAGIIRPNIPAPPVITLANTQRVRGTAAAGRVIQVFLHSTVGCTAAPCQGRTLLGSVTTPASGIWQLDLNVGQVAAGNQVTATSTQNGNNTSAFSACAAVVSCAVLTVNTTVSNIPCFGGNTGNVSAAVSGGATPYTFIWSNGGNTPTISNLVANTYTVTVTEARSCTASATAVVTQPSALTLSIATVGVPCFGGNTGSATANPGGGVLPYTYAWSSGQTAQTATNLSAGVYTVTVRDRNNCSIVRSATVTQPTALTLAFDVQQVSCAGGANGSIFANPSGGAPPYTFQWSNGQTAQTAINLVAGVYSLTLRDRNNCVLTQSATITQPNPLVVGLTIQNALCAGGNAGSIAATATGGTPPYSFAWSNGQIGPTATNLPAGTYTVTLTDGADCTTARSGTVNQPPPLGLSIAVQNVACFGGSTGSATANPTGGNPPYTYVWNNGQTSRTATNLIAGTYTVTLRDNNNCSTVQNATVGQPANLSVTIMAQNPTCFGGSNGSATATAAGGVSPYTYAWSNGQATRTATNLVAGAYIVTVTDTNGCTRTATANVGQPTALDLSMGSTHQSAVGVNNGTASASVSGGTPGYTYVWSNGGSTPAISNLAPGTYTVTVTDTRGCTIVGSATVNPFVCSGLSVTVVTGNALCNGTPTGTASATPSGSSAYTYTWSTGATTQNIANLAAGTYTVTLRDGAGCSTTANGVVGQPSALTLSISTQNPNCFGGINGSATATPGGGIAPYTYAWSNGQTTQTAANLVAGAYVVTLTDTNGCTRTSTANVGQPTALGLSVGSTHQTAVGVNNGTATASPSGGTPGYVYVWSNGGSAPAISNLAPGTYTVTVTDTRGCTIVGSATVNPFVCSGLSVSVTTGNATCNGTATGTASATPNGSSGYTYAWSNGATTQNIANLAAGTYTVTLHDGTGCVTTANGVVGQPVALTLSISVQNATCPGMGNGSATVSPGGGTGPYTYLWSNGQTSQTAASLSAGTYTVTLRDNNNCTTSQSASVGPAALSLAVSTQNPACFGSSNGSATINPSGGAMPFAYAWSNGQTTQTATNLAAGTYTATLTDANACTHTTTANLGQPTALGLFMASTPSTAFGANNGTASASPYGGTPGYVYVWSNGGSTSTISSLIPGTYTVTVTDMNGCSRSALVDVGTGGTGGGCVTRPVYAVLTPSKVCGNEPFALAIDDLNPSSKIRYHIYIPTGDSIFTANKKVNITPRSTAFAGEYFVVRDSLGCRSKAVGGVPIEVVSFPPDSVSAGSDMVICASGVVPLNARTPAGSKGGNWLSLGKAKVDNPNAPSTTARDLVPGANRFVWRVPLPSCANAGVDTVTFFWEKRPTLRDDRYTIAHAQDQVRMEVLLNDQLAGHLDTIVRQVGPAPSVGTLTYSSQNKQFLYEAPENFKGVVLFQYAVCAESPTPCGFDCDTATVEIAVLNMPKVTEGLVLDDPGPNGALEIKGAIGFKRVEIQIFNRWGDLVYFSKDYAEEMPWKGTFKGQTLPQGAYYYQLRAFEDGDKQVGEVEKGVVYLVGD